MKHFLLLFLLVSSLTALAQKEANIWYFGEYAGLDFNRGEVTVLKNGKTNTQEGTTSVADKNGNLLFYSDGITVWNKNHTPMPNGFGLTGHKSAIQSVIAVPKPGSATLYYLFTVDAIENDLSNGLRYSVLDMSLQNGLGDITATKNVLLEAPVTEKLTVVRHTNNKDFWILVHKWNSYEFSSYLLTSLGVNTKPVISKTSFYHGGEMLNAIGFLKASVDGKKLALAVRGSNRFELFNFDAKTGLLSNGIVSPEIYVNALGVEFSPDGKKLYGAVATSRQIFQFDLTASKTQIFSSGFVIGNSVDVLCGLQLAPDGRIYATRRYSNYLGVIQNPNQTGTASNFVDDGLYLGSGKYVWFSLPNFLPQYLQIQPIIESFDFTNTCEGDSTLFTIENILSNHEYVWNFGDLKSGASNLSTKLKPAHKFTNPGQYLVKLTVKAESEWYSIEKKITIYGRPLLYLGADTTLCKDEKLMLGKSIGNVSYKWQDNSTQATYEVTKSGKYWVEIINENGCSYTDTIEVKYRENSCQPIIPNIITPNGDGLNETFSIKGAPNKKWQIKIFNRWGNLVYQNPNYENEWNAGQQPDGVYYYVLHDLTSQQTLKGYVEVMK
ncbi:T9SS type B sorting domain-containing protein [Adhaeribacter radiodurans]|uniref:Gliding motility-associated C-terminal domain-containing protein n=1 Tax=Adhaeribacter radiodurans TaxID=2745197 RepID=A0A7L7L833_9BACT|nr:gliding motility-associated C-terminal domain-containing protein [Adhaeribacter radiodurans]QMU28976.1 gliding motility-associated C-terminal domain-containing protein [Adhaeribacter radiodurans]